MAIRGTTVTFELDVPATNVFARAAAETSADCQTNCDNVPTCASIKCKSNQQCQQQTRTGCVCQSYYCVDVSGPATGTNVGGIVGGVVGGVGLLIIAGVVYFLLVYRRKHPVQEDDDIEMGSTGSQYVDNDNDSSYVISNIDSHIGDPNSSPLPGASSGAGSIRGTGRALAPPERRPANRRLSTYESFTRPTARHAPKKVQNRSINNQQRLQQQRQQERMQQQLQQHPYLDPNTSNRNSVATSISTTNASNILPIAYIPGVTVRPTINNTRSIYSYETESVFSDLNTIENASIIGAKHHHIDGASQKDSTMTAIKAQPRLVNVGKIEEEEEEEDYDDDDDDEVHGVHGVEEVSDRMNDSDITRIENSGAGVAKNHHMSLMDGTTDESEDSDIDSDIGEIVRATSLRRSEANGAHQQTQDEGNSETLLNLVEIERPPQAPLASVQSPQSSLQGSFLLDVDILRTTTKGSGGSSSPFEDPTDRL
ncbi:hypothetical protein CAAN1_08S05732 [[Candida] anglica]|uniref:Membrane anchor Opy2 N-terminal domain-containing protein n=1 Tax=[Candida] anglica TaxID=148631 RepID=A0ABP0E5Q3_9ASCO